MWILLQGKKEPPKMQSKSQWRLYVGFDDRSNCILYYNAKTRKNLKSCNYHFLTPPQQSSPPKEIEVAPNLPCEGEKESGTWSSGEVPGLKRKQDDEEFEPRKTRGLRYNYRYLNNPFPDEEANDAILTSDDQQYAIIAGDKLTCPIIS